jgi:hypothetical protein
VRAGREEGLIRMAPERRAGGHEAVAGALEAERVEAAAGTPEAERVRA